MHTADGDTKRGAGLAAQEMTCCPVASWAASAPRRMFCPGTWCLCIHGAAGIGPRGNLGHRRSAGGHPEVGLQQKVFAHLGPSLALDSLGRVGRVGVAAVSQKVSQPHLRVCAMQTGLASVALQR